MYYNVMVDFIIKWYQFYMPFLPHIIIVCSAIVVLPFSHMLTCLPILFWDFKIWKANAFFKLWLALFSVKIIASCLLVYAESVLGLFIVTSLIWHAMLFFINFFGTCLLPYLFSMPHLRMLKCHAFFVSAFLVKNVLMCWLILLYNECNLKCSACLIL